MSSSIFRTIPRMGDFKIPFRLKKHLLLEWLLGLSNYGAYEACSSILQLLQALNDVNLSAKTRISFLKTSHEYLKQYIHKLDDSCWDATLPLSEKEHNYADTVVWNYLILSEGFFIAVQDAGVKAEEMFALYMAFYSLGQAQLHRAATYTTANEGFWQLAYKLFAWAEKRKLLNIPINNSNLKDVRLQTLFVQLVIFHSCDSTQFRPRDIRTIFKFLPGVCGNLTIYKLSAIKFQTEVLKVSYLRAILNSFSNLSVKLAEKINDRQDLFVFDTTKDIAPSIFNNTHSLSSTSLRYFTAATVIENLAQIIEKGEMWGGILKLINHELFGRVIKTLEPGKKRKHARVQAGYTLLGIIGFESIISFLYKVNQKKNLKTKVDVASKLSSLEKLKLYSNNMQSHMQVVDNDFSESDFAYPSGDSDIWDNKNALDITNRPVSIKKLNIFDKSAQGYSVHWADDQNSKAKIGDIFGIISEDRKHLEIAIIRRVAVISGENYKFGSEVLGFESEAVIIAYVNGQGVGGWGVFIPGIKALEQADSVIYQMGNFQLGDRVYIYRQNKKVKATLIKALNTTAAIAHTELDYSVS